MVNLNYAQLCSGEFDKIVCAKDRVEDISLKRLEIKVNDAQQKYEKKLKFEPFIEENVVSKAYLDSKVSKVEAHISFEEKNRRSLTCMAEKHSEEESLLEKAVKAINKKPSVEDSLSNRLNKSKY